MLLFLLAWLPVMAFAVLAVDYDLNIWRHRRNGKCALDWLMDHTGIVSRIELERLIGPRPADCLYHLSPETLATLPWNSWRLGPNRVILNVIAMTTALVSLLWTCMSGQPAWLILAPGAAYLVIGIIWTVAVEYAYPSDERATHEIEADDLKELAAQSETQAAPRRRRGVKALDLESLMSFPFLDWVPDDAEHIHKLGCELQQRMQELRKECEADWREASAEAEQFERDLSWPPLMRIVLGAMMRRGMKRLHHALSELLDTTQGFLRSYASAVEARIAKADEEGAGGFALEWRRVGELIGKEIQEFDALAAQFRAKPNDKLI